MLVSLVSLVALVALVSRPLDHRLENKPLC